MSEKPNPAKLRPLYILRILYEHTDENHMISIAQISKVLKEKHQIDAHRKTIKDDLDALIEDGYDIELVKSSQNQYHLLSREFDIAELKVLIDAVASSKFIPEGRSQILITKLSKLGGPFAEEPLKRNINVEGRIKCDNRSLLVIIDTINTAINQKKKIAFKYFSYNVRKEKKERHNGSTYKFSPYNLIWNGDFYYVVGYSDKHNDVVSFRVDRISVIPEVLDEDAVSAPHSFNISKYLNSMFHMYNGEHRKVELICDNSVMDSIVDRFGDDVKVYTSDTENFKVCVNIVVSHVFYSWVFGFGGKVKIKGPEEVKNEYSALVKKAFEVIQ